MQKLTIKELAEAAQAFARANFEHDKMPNLMNLLQEQTTYMQKRFWKLADALAESKGE